MTIRRTRSVSINTRPLRIAPSAPHANSNWDCAPAVESVLFHQPLTSPGIASRTSCRDHAMRTDADLGILTPPQSHSVPSVASMLGLLHPCLVWVLCDPRQTDAAALQMDKEQNVVCHQPTPSEDL